MSERRPDDASSPSGRAGTSGLPRAGDILAAKYAIERVLGVGGMGVVVAARHLHLGQRVAIKFIRNEGATDPVTVGRFLREARAAVALSSDHVAKVLDVGTLETGAPYMVLEYLDGLDLAATLQRGGPLSLADATSMVLQASEAIAEAHSLGIVHRDLKLSNLFVVKDLDGSPRVKVLDFGISKWADALTADGHSLTSTGSMMGSPGTMAPEQVRNSKDVDARADVWALGVILYELLSGVQPFRGETLGETFARILTEPIASVRTVRPELPEGLATAIARCLERDRERRTQSVAELALSLLPFANPAAARSVERILWIAGAAGRSQAPRRDALPAGTESPAAGVRIDVTATATPWDRPNTAPPPPSRRRIAWIVLGGGLAAAAVAALLVMGRMKSVGAGHPDGVAIAAPLASTQPPPSVSGPLTPPVEAAPVIPGVPVEPMKDAGAPGEPRVAPARPLPPAKPAAPTPPRSSNSPAPAASHHETDIF